MHGILKVRSRDGSPPDNTANLWAASREFEQPPRLFEPLPCLDGHGTSDSCVREFNYEIGRKEVAANGRHAVVDPFIFRGRVAPEVGMGVDNPNVFSLQYAHEGLRVPFNAIPITGRG